ncbi:hypothetical protein [Rubritalea profundi]|uniref:D-ribose pyranase n=1 Tax=Rubritalea profundi TaxID=1658618 RepID=A0A2S7U5Z8_9BACT|nr:hypothetical protein [Rubritalea profundi]PQJ29613.1 hypothetical protein BSZ32_14685 [Rubritalea profundi]
MIKHFLLLTFALLSCCAPIHPRKQQAWTQQLESEIAELGAYNWILVTESAYPAPGRPEAHTVTSPYKLPQTLDYVLQTIESSGHIRPRIYLTLEFDELSDSYAPGIENHRVQLTKSLNERATQSLSARSLESTLRCSKNGNRILVVKSQTALPYTSIYIELESGYWDGESETALRNKER